MKNGEFQIVRECDGLRIAYKPRGKTWVIHVPDVQKSGLISALLTLSDAQSGYVYVGLDGDTSGKADFAKKPKRKK